jgi:LPXTG-motif cell wall-anchored protein
MRSVRSVRAHLKKSIPLAAAAASLAVVLALIAAPSAQAATSTPVAPDSPTGTSVPDSTGTSATPASGTDATIAPGQTATPPPGPMPTPDPSATPASDLGTPPTVLAAHTSAAVEYTASVVTAVNTDKVGLTGGRFTSKKRGTDPAHHDGAVSVPENGQTDMETINTPDSDVQTFTYQIVLLGTPTNYWVRGNVDLTLSGWSNNFYLTVNCQVYRGDPDSGAIPIPSGVNVPYVCDSSTEQLGSPPYVHEHAQFTVRNNLDAEVQSKVITTGSVSLDQGYWEVNAGAKWGGSTAVAANSSVDMDALLRSGDGDIVVDETTARAIFVYRILVDGVATPYWLEGTNQVLRAAAFHHDASCIIYDQNPVPVGGAPVPAPAKFSPFTCSMNEYMTGSWRGDWHTDFTISAEPVTTVTAPIQLSDMLQHCGEVPDDCNTELATVTLVPGPANPNDDKNTLNNLTDHDQLEKLTVASTHGVTNTAGVKVTGKTMLSIFEVSVETSYSIAITDSATYTNEKDVTAPPWTRVWLEQTPILVHVVGSVLVHKDGKYYLLPNLAANFPEKGGLHTEATIRSQPLPHSGAQQLSASGINAVISTTDSAVSGQSVGLTDGTFDLPVDASGPITATSTPAALTLAPNGSTAWSTIEHQADPSVSGGAITHGSFSYRITQNDVPGPYWVKGAAVNGYNADGTRNTSATCQVYLGDPNAEGVPAAADAPYQCVTAVTPPNEQHMMTASFSVGPRLATLTPAGPVTTPPTTGIPAAAGAPALNVATSSGLADTGSSMDATAFLAGILALLAGAGVVITRRRRIRKG